MPQPGVAAVGEHAGPGEHRIGDGQGGDVRRDGCAWIDELGPGEGEQQQAGGPDAQRFRVGQAAPELAATAQPPVKPLRAVEGGPPRIDERPNVAGKRRNVGEPHPPDDPHQGGGDVAVGIPIAEEAGQDRHHEQAEHGEPQRHDDGRMPDHAPERRGEQVDLGVCAGCRRAAHEQAEDDEGERNRGRGTKEIEPERQRQLVALAEAMRRRWGSGTASGSRKHPRGGASAGGPRCGQAEPHHASGRPWRSACAPRPGTFPWRGPRRPFP